MLLGKKEEYDTLHVQPRKSNLGTHQNNVAKPGPKNNTEWVESTMDIKVQNTAKMRGFFVQKY
jgi:hypothetical protein